MDRCGDGTEQAGTVSGGLWPTEPWVSSTKVGGFRGEH